MLLVTYCSAEVTAVKSSGDVWDDLRRIDLNIQLLASEAEGSNIVQSAECLETPFAQPPQDWIMAQLPEPQLPVRIAVRVLQFDRCDINTAVWAAPGMNGEEFVVMVASNFLTDQRYFNMFEAYQQPFTDAVVMGIAPRWWRNSRFVPVLFDDEEINRPMTLRMPPKVCTYDDLRECFAFAFWPPGTKLIFEPTEGSLFRVLPEGAEIGLVRELGIALQNLDWAWDVEAKGMQPDPDRWQSQTPGFGT